MRNSAETNILLPLALSHHCVTTSFIKSGSHTSSMGVLLTCLAVNQAPPIMAAVRFAPIKGIEWPSLSNRKAKMRMLSRLTFSSGCWQSCPWWSRASGWSPRAPPWCGAPSRQLLEITSLRPQQESTTAQLSLKWTQTALQGEPKLPWERSHLDWSRGSFLGRGWVAAAADYTPLPVLESRTAASTGMTPRWIFSTSSSSYLLLWISKPVLTSKQPPA